MNRKFQKESSCDYILPDYLGDVRKVLKTNASLSPTGQFSGEGSCDVSGVVNYEMIYLDSDNKLSSASFTSDYDFSFPKSDESYVDSYVDSEISSYSIRVTGPRRLSAKCSVMSEISVIEASSPSAVGDGMLDESIEKITKNVRREVLTLGESAERELAEEIERLENIPAEDIEIITSSAFVKITETNAVDGGVEIRGSVVVGAVIRTPEMTPFAIKREIPFSETVKIGEDTAITSSSADVRATSCVVSAVDSDEGARINANLILELRPLGYSNEELTLDKDAYLKSCECENKYDDFKFTEHITASCECCAVSDRIGKADSEYMNLSKILTLDADFKIKELERERNSVKIKADMMLSGIACEINENGEENLLPFKLARETEMNVSLNCQIDDKMTVSAKISPASCEFDADEDNIYIKSEPTVSILVGRELSEKILTECVALPDTEYQRSASCINVYYPEEDETLFEIAKKFHTTASLIAKDNNVTEPISSLDGSFELSSGYNRLIIR